MTILFYKKTLMKYGELPYIISVLFMSSCFYYSFKDVISRLYLL